MISTIRSIQILGFKELKGYFDSLTAYILLILFLGLSGFFTWMFGTTIFFINQASLQIFFGVSFWTLFFFIPALTMRSLAEEQRSGTLELLATKPISHMSIVLAKFKACIFLVFIALLATTPYYITISWLGDVDHGAVIGGYLALMALTKVYTALGIFASSMTDNQIVAFLIALALGALLQIVFGLMGASMPTNMLGGLFRYLSMETHYAPLSRGVIDLGDLLYFGSLTIGFLYLAKAMLDKRKW